MSFPFILLVDAYSLVLNHKSCTSYVHEKYNSQTDFPVTALVLDQDIHMLCCRRLTGTFKVSIWYLVIFCALFLLHHSVGYAQINEKHDRIRFLAVSAKKNFATF